MKQLHVEGCVLYTCAEAQTQYCHYSTEQVSVGGSDCIFNFSDLPAYKNHSKI